MTCKHYGDKKQMKKTRLILMRQILSLEIMCTKYLLHIYAFFKIRGRLIPLKPEVTRLS
jgi:hypothetical protein